MGRVQGKVAIVTGGGSGIGRASALLLAREGAAVVVTDLDEGRARAVAQEIEAAGGTALAVQQNVAEESSWKRLLAVVLGRFGRLDIVLNNAGVQVTQSIEETSLDDWRHHMAVNAEGVFLGTKYAIGAMKKNGGGSIINISSTYGLVGEELNAPYCASKFAVRGLTKSAALHCGKEGYNIRVNSILPGCVRTPLVEQEASDVLRQTGSSDREALFEHWRNEHPIGRLGRPEDIAHGVLFLASDESSFMTGAELVIDGGYTAQ